MNLSGPDEPAIYCWPPDGCCGPSPCVLTEEEFVCAIRALLPEGEPWNNTRSYIPSQPQHKGATTVGCARVGCEQLVFGGCCDTAILCEDEPPLAPQLAVVDAFGAVAYGVVQALCAMLRELDPCTATYTLPRWAERLGVINPDPCGPGWSDQILAFLVCLYVRLRYQVWNAETLSRFAGLFGVCITLREPGHFNCDGPGQGWWTMARTNSSPCPPVRTCDGSFPVPPLIRLVPQCYEPEDLSLNVILCPCEIVVPPNCNLRPVVSPRPHDPVLYQLFKEWLLPELLPPSLGSVCYIDCDPANCVE